MDEVQQVARKNRIETYNKISLVVDKIVNSKFEEMAKEIGDVLFVFEDEANGLNMDVLAEEMDIEHHQMVKCFKSSLTNLIASQKML